ncbi:uncharacterized protein LOC111540651 isoform X3 [Piliocolobus tephrosceles]|uniref:uncharacterized protein LOC111540651 isoform X3 n=1 Tax=Piliocolobus tephrosceles TaxID=591936 RepID=UPI001300FE1C|nr:uncharacterized protein LOC111540651 isoform X3 [Piliocolobus tephrosceles]
MLLYGKRPRLLSRRGTCAPELRQAAAILAYELYGHRNWACFKTDLLEPSNHVPYRQPDVQRSIRVEEEELAGTSGDHPRAEQTIHGQNDAEFGPGSRKRAQGKPFPFWVPHLLRATSTQ